MTHKASIIYMGTPEFSVPALKKLAANDSFKICLVVTQPDKPKGRGKKFAASAVKSAAMELGIEVFQPENIRDAEKKISDYSPDFFVVTAYGQILPENILKIPEIYPINIHSSLLPLYRGASPIQSAILNREPETGVSTMVMDKGMDTGDILISASTPINQWDTAEDLHERLSNMGADLIVETLSAILEKKITPKPQDHSKASYTKILKKSDGKINWNLTALQILAHINAMASWPGAFSSLNGKHIKIFKVALDSSRTSEKPGVIFHCDKNGIYVSTGNGSIIILELMGSSGKRLKASEFLCGHTIEPPLAFDSD
jgi:methionyl-tRNA formyltransferase